MHFLIQYAIVKREIDLRQFARLIQSKSFFLFAVFTSSKKSARFPLPGRAPRPHARVCEGFAQIALCPRSIQQSTNCLFMELTD